MSGLPNFAPAPGNLVDAAGELDQQEPRPETSQTFAAHLLRWYDSNARDLPWRQNRDPYRVWVSEIMLQQTRVAAVLEHYRQFLKKFPTVQKLAAARESSVLAAWSGLGYYRRARMLHAAARAVVKDHGGVFPDTSVGLRDLPGIGRYTAAAIASIAFQEPVAVVDGNVERVVSRMSGAQVSGEPAWKYAEGLLDPSRPGDFNQAMMELGATVCLPRQPRCLLCPVASLCVTRGDLPPVSPAAKQHKRVIRIGLAKRKAHIFLVRRSDDESLMPGFWELPQIVSDKGATIAFTLRHSITVTDYTVQVVEVAQPTESKGKWVPFSRLASLPLTGLARKILRRTEIL